MQLVTVMMAEGEVETDVGHNAARIPHITDGQIGKGQDLKGPTTTSSAEGTGDIIYRNSLDGMPSRDFTIELWTGDITNVPAGRTVELYNDLVSFCTRFIQIS